ncbi:radical SAM protein [Acetivibrio clariflavus]|uniref:radical SAM/SPASM domain-containing protein n=1 Tax=Acetivibrio clariflavus TaxID=288965 RepID=UPI0031F5A5D4
MGSFERYIEMNNEIWDAMKKCDNSENVENLIEFLKNKNDKYSYNKETGKYYLNSFFPSFPGAAWNRFINGIYEVAKYNKRIPFQADITVTGKCHCKCWHCFRADHISEDLEFEKIRECIMSLYKLGTASVGITGGEPMLREDILEIIRLIPDGMEGQLYTTGHRIDETFVSKIKETNLTRCIISLDHFEESKACKLRNNPDAFKEAVHAIDLLTKNNVYTAVTVCITNDLMKQGAINKYFEFVKDLGVHEIRVILPIPQGNLEGKEVGSFYGRAMGLVKQLRREYASRKDFPTIVNFCEFESEDYFGCGAGANYISINNDGAVMPCVAVPLSYGNVYDDTLENIFENMKECFPTSDCVCFGIASGRIISKENIDTSKKPLPQKISVEIAKKCRVATERAAIFKCL